MAKDKVMKFIITYALCIVLSWPLIETTWGVTVGMVSGVRFGLDKTMQEKVMKILKDAGVGEKDMANKDYYKKLPPPVREEIQKLVKSSMQDMNVFALTLFVSATAFALLGFFSGLFTRSFLFAGIFVLISFALNNPIIRFGLAKELPLLQKGTVAAAQFGACYAFAYLGALLGKRRDKKRLEKAAYTGS